MLQKGTGNDPNSKPLLFDIDLIEELKQPLNLKSSFSVHINELHDQVYAIFQSSLSSNFEKFLNKKRI